MKQTNTMEGKTATIRQNEFMEVPDNVAHRLYKATKTTPMKQKIEGGKKKSYLVGEFKDTGINAVDIELVVKDWSHLWFLSQYGAKFKLLRNGRKNYIKTEISSQQADELIEKLGLGAEKAHPFRKALNWKQND